MSETYDRPVRARKPHICEGNWRSHHWIQAGDIYWRTVMFPGDVNSYDRPWVMRICARCWRRAA